MFDFDTRHGRTDGQLFVHYQPEPKMIFSIYTHTPRGSPAGDFYTAHEDFLRFKTAKS